MKIKIVFWYPSKLQEMIPYEIEYDNLKEWIVYLNGFGLNVLVPANLLESKTIYVDEKMFTQR